MSGPWESYKKPAEQEPKPWEQYNAAEPKPERSMLDRYVQMNKDAFGGLIRGAGSIGSTLWAPVDMASDYMDGKGLSLQSNRERRDRLDRNMRDLVGANPDALLYKGGKFTGEVAGTAGAGGLLANGARAVGAAPAVSTALASGGFQVGGMTGLPAWALRAAAGSATGAASAGLVEPENAGIGAVLGGALPGAVRVAGALGGKVADSMSSGAKRLMQSAIKPTIKQLKSGEAATAVEMMLKYGINPTKGGVAKVRSLIDDLNSQIETGIAGSTAQIDKAKVVKRLDDVRTKFGNQVSPTADLNAIKGAADDFMGHPNYPGNSIPVAAAQEMKQGTYQVLKGKFGQVGSADTEAQKGLARGLKEEIAEAVPGIGALNAEESKLIATLGVAERRALIELNKNPGGLANLAHSPAAWAAMMADKSALFKSLAARMVNSSAGGMRNSGPRLENRLSNPLLRSPQAIPLVRGDGE